MIRLLCVIACLTGLAGCATAPFPAPDPQAKTLSGQMRYAGKERSFVGDFTARVSPNDFQLDVAKGPGVTLLSVRTSGATLARFEGAGRSWQGNPQRFAPAQLKSWLALHDPLLKATQPESLKNGTLNFSVVKSNYPNRSAQILGKARLESPGGHPLKLEVEFATGERFTFRF